MLTQPVHNRFIHLTIFSSRDTWFSLSVGQHRTGNVTGLVRGLGLTVDNDFTIYWWPKWPKETK